MKFFIVVAVALVCLAEAKKPSGKGGKGGKGSGSGSTGGKGAGGKGDEGEMENMCGDMDPKKIGTFCVAGTAMGIKMEVAVNDCYGDIDTMPVTGRAGKGGKGKGKGKGGKGSAIAGAITAAVTGGSGKGGKGSGSTGGKGAGGKGDEGEKENMCGDIDPMMIGTFCVAGTAMGTKMEEAVAECYGADTMPVTSRAGKGKGKGKGKGGKGSAIAGAITAAVTGGSGKGGKGSAITSAVTGGSGKAGKGGKGKPSKPSKGKGGKGKGGKGKGGKGGKGDSCPSFDDITSHLASEFADESCFMEKMGWTDNDMNFMEDVFAADMATLNTDLTDRIDEQEISDCAAKMVEKMGTEGEKCASSYTAEEIDNLTLIGQTIAHGTCGHKAFKTACMTYAKESFLTFITNANTK